MPHFRKEATIISLGISCHASEIHEQITSSDGFFCPPAVNSWIPSAISSEHCLSTPCLGKHPLAEEAKLIRQKKQQDSCSLSQSPLSRFLSREPQTRHKQAGFASSAGHRVATAILFRSRSSFGLHTSSLFPVQKQRRHAAQQS